MAAVLEELRRNPIRAPWTYGIGVAIVAVALLLGQGLILLGVAILVPTAIAVAQRPQRGVVIFSALLPFDGILHDLGPAWVVPWKQVFILALLIATFFCPTSARAQTRRQAPSWLLAFIVLVGLGLLSSLSQDRNTALVGLRLSYFSGLLGLTIWRCPFDRRDRDQVVSVFLALSIITSLVGLWQQTVSHQYLHTLGYAYNDTLRFTTGFTLRSFSTFNLPFPFAFYLMLAILIGLPMALAQPKRLRSKIFFASLPLVLLALFFTFVRGAMLGLAIGLLYLAFHRYKLLVYGIPLVLLAALFIPSGATFSSAVFSTSSLGDRTLSWNDRIDRFAENPLGTGIGTTGAAAEKAAKLNFKDPNATYVPDSSWLKVLFELGVFGLWIFVIWLMQVFFFTRATERRCVGIDRDFVVGATAQLLALMVGGLVTTYFELTPMDQLFWLMLGAVATIAPVPTPAAPNVGEAARARSAD
ncbi:MAG: O-antigen ligase family protein [Acidimicrobiia bacterium]